MVAAPGMPELGSAVETTKLGLKSGATPISVETEPATAPDMPELESSAEPSTKSIAAPVSVELEIAAMPSAPDLCAEVVCASVEPEAAAEAAGAFESEAAPFDGTGPASLN